MYARYVVIWLPSYGMKKDSLKKKMSEGNNTETEKGRAIVFVDDTPS